MVKMLNLTMLALVMFSLNARCDSPTNAEGPAVKAEEPGVYVTGGVQKPNRYGWFKGMTVFDAIKAAGGLIDPSIPTVRVIITHADQTKISYQLSPGTDAAKKSPSLQAGDKVYVAIIFKPAPFPTPSPKPAN
jgi:SLBB domain